jgi:hypothetical protein
MDSSVSSKDEIWFLRVCLHISNAVYKHRANASQHYVIRTLPVLVRCQRLVILGPVHSKLTKTNAEIEHRQTETTVKVLSTHTHRHTNTHTYIHTCDKTQTFSRRFSVLSCNVLSYPVHIQRTAAVKLIHCVALQGKWRRTGHTLGCGCLYTPRINKI